MTVGLAGGLSGIVYSSDGERLSVANTTSVARAVSAMDADADADFDPDITDEDIMSLAATTVDKTEYRGMAVYKDNKPYMLLFRGGYVTFESGVTFHYYTPDYLGNNRAVVNGTTGAIEQTVAYYPFGGVIANLGTGHSLQQYKFGGKELLTVNGLNEYDFGARRYYQAVPMFTQPDPFASKFPWLSPYVYCANNPVNVIDPDGEIIETIWDVGNVLYDVGAAAYNHIVGDHKAAESHWIDAGVDLLAVAIPGLPAGVTKAVKAASVAEKGVKAVSTGTKAAKVAKSSAKTTNKSIKYARDSAVKKAWKEEKELVGNTRKGSRHWTNLEKEELLTNGKVKGYEGRHINSVKAHPELEMVGNPDNIKFVNKTEHLLEHRGNFRNPTEGILINRKY